MASQTSRLDSSVSRKLCSYQHDLPKEQNCLIARAITRSKLTASMQRRRYPRAGRFVPACNSCIPSWDHLAGHSNNI